MKKFLKMPFEYLGGVPQDDKLVKAVMQQTPVSMMFPNAKASCAYENIVNRLMNKEEAAKAPKRGMAAFFSHIITNKNRS